METAAKPIDTKSAEILARAAERHDLTVAAILDKLDWNDLYDYAEAIRDYPHEVLRYQLPDAVRAAKHARDAQAVQEAREARAARHAGCVCERCGGEGGHTSWPGFVCFDCDGRGWVEKS